jgi:hypothetical protein
LTGFLLATVFSAVHEINKFAPSAFYFVEIDDFNVIVSDFLVQMFESVAVKNYLLANRSMQFLPQYRQQNSVIESLDLSELADIFPSFGEDELLQQCLKHNTILSDVIESELENNKRLPQNGVSVSAAQHCRNQDWDNFPRL